MLSVPSGQRGPNVPTYTGDICTVYTHEIQLEKNVDKAPIQGYTRVITELNTVLPLFKKLPPCDIQVQQIIVLSWHDSTEGAGQELKLVGGRLGRSALGSKPRTTRAKTEGLALFVAPPTH